MKIRLIVTSTESGSEESVTFSEEFDISADDFCPNRHTVDSDTIMDIDLPSGFPMEYTLMRS